MELLKKHQYRDIFEFGMTEEKFAKRKCYKINGKYFHPKK